MARGHGGLGRIDPKAQKITVYLPPRTMSGTAGTLDADMNGNVWVTSPDGALRFDTKEEKFTEFKSVTYKMQPRHRRPSMGSPPTAPAMPGGC